MIWSKNIAKSMGLLFTHPHSLQHDDELSNSYYGKKQENTELASSTENVLVYPSLCPRDYNSINYNYFEQWNSSLVQR